MIAIAGPAGRRPFFFMRKLRGKHRYGGLRKGGGGYRGSVRCARVSDASDMCGVLRTGCNCRFFCAHRVWRGGGLEFARAGQVPALCRSEKRVPGGQPALFRFPASACATLIYSRKRTVRCQWLFALLTEAWQFRHGFSILRAGENRIFSMGPVERRRSALRENRKQTHTVRQRIEW